MEKVLGKISDFPAMSGVLGWKFNLNRIKITAEKRVAVIGADFN